MSGMTLGEAIAAYQKMLKRIGELESELAELKAREEWKSPDEKPESGKWVPYPALPPPAPSRVEKKS